MGKRKSFLPLSLLTWRKFEEEELPLRVKNGTNGFNGGTVGTDTNSGLPRDEHKEYINFGEEDQMEIVGYERSTMKTILTWIFICLTVGILRLVFHWWPQLMLYATHRPCSIAKAEIILGTEHYQHKYKRYHVKPVFILSTDLFRSYKSVKTFDVDDETFLDNMEEMDKKSRKVCGENYKNIEVGCDIHVETERNGYLSSLKYWFHEQLIKLLPIFYFFFNINYSSTLHSSIVRNSRTHRRSGTVFPSVGLPVQTTPTSKLEKTSEKSWHANLEDELQNMDTLKLAIPNADGTIKETTSIRVFNCKKLRYIWNEETGIFEKLPGFDNAITSNLHKSTGLSIFEQCQRRLIYGNNEIKVEIQSIVKLLFLEVLNPFYVFQIFSVTLWMSDEYYYFATAIIIMSGFGIISTIIQTRQNQKKLKTTVQSSDIVTVARGNEIFESIPTEHLVPGDLIVIPPHGCTMQCDAALLVGTCIVNESMLTGESVPVTKSALPNRSDVQYDTKEHARHTLFCGTHVMQTRYYGNEKVLAVVLRTGFLTAKGSLVRSIMYPPPVDYKFENDSYIFIAVLTCIAGIGFIYSVFTKVANNEAVRDIIVDSLDLITIVVPPALPAAMTVGRFYAQRRLQKQGIYCISPRAINVSGSIDCVCFDKTGTLTEEGLDLWGIVPLVKTEKVGDTPTTTIITRKPTFGEPIRDAAQMSPDTLMVGMAACHSLTRLDEKLIGDPLDLKMFEWIGWTLEEPSVADNEKFDILAPTIVRPKPEVNANITEKKQQFGIGTEVGIVRQFPFSSSLQRMSVITRTLGDSEYELYCKGSPEMISSLSLQHSIPKNFATILESYTQEGYRVIAVGHKRLPKLNYLKVQRVVREELETELIFLGLIVMENRLKPETTGVMTVLKNAAIRTIMVTGDNMLTAISVAKECGMLEASDKVIVLSTESVTDSKDRVPRVQYTFANKMNPKEMTTSPIDSSVDQSPQMSILSRNNRTKFNNEFVKNIVEVETPSNRYHFALTGHVFGIVRTHYPELLSRLLVRGTVFARMSPEQKQQLVELLQGLGYFVGMCGDGSNDCGALKAAHAGISLSDTESSVAAPFTSKEPNITCVPHLIREGRGALVTSFGIFKYMAIYSLTQFVTVILLYSISSNLTDIQFLYIDLFLISVFAFFFGNSEPNPGPLVKQPPSASLVSAPPIVSILLHIISIIGFQVLAFIYTQQQPWFEPYRFDPATDEAAIQFAGHQNYSLFIISCFQYIIMAIIFSRGKPHRKSIFSNPGLIISLTILTSFTIYLNLYPFEWLRQAFLLIRPPEVYNFRLILLGFALAQFLIALFIEHWIVDYLLTKKILKCITSMRQEKSKKEYVRIEYELSRRCDWPPISNTPSVDSVYISNEELNNSTKKIFKGTEDLNNRHNQSITLTTGSIPQSGPGGITSSSGDDDRRHSSTLSSSFSRPRPRSRTTSSTSNTSIELQNQNKTKNLENIIINYPTDISSPGKSP